MGIDRSAIRIERSAIRIDRSAIRIDRSVIRIDRSAIRIDRYVQGIDRYVEGIDRYDEGIDRYVEGIDRNVPGMCPPRVRFEATTSATLAGTAARAMILDVMRTSWLLSLAFGGATSVAVGCSGGTSSPPSTTDGGRRDAPSGPRCSTSSDCGLDLSCLFVPGSCSAMGECLAIDSLGGTCATVVTYCGCNGHSVDGLCGPNYAFGPTLGLDAPCGPAPVAIAGETLTTLWQNTSSRPEWLATDGTNVYLAGAGGTVLQVPVGGGVPVTLATSKDPQAIAVAGREVFWADEGGAVMKVAVGGGTPVTLASGQDLPDRIVVDGNDLYWTNAGNPSAVMTVPIDGGTATTFAAASGPAFAVTVDGTSVYWLDGYGVASKPTTGGAVTTLASAQGPLFDLVVKGSTLYWSNGGGEGAIVSMPKAGGTPTTLVTGTSNARLATDAQSLYFTNTGGGANDGSVVSIALAGGGTTTLVTGQSAPEGIAVDGASVYWVDTDLGALMKLSHR